MSHYTQFPTPYETGCHSYRDLYEPVRLTSQANLTHKLFYQHSGDGVGLGALILEAAYGIEALGIRIFFSRKGKKILIGEEDILTAPIGWLESTLDDKELSPWRTHRHSGTGRAYVPAGDLVYSAMNPRAMAEWISQANKAWEELTEGMELQSTGQRNMARIRRVK